MRLSLCIATPILAALVLAVSADQGSSVRQTKHDVWAEETRAVPSDMPVLTAALSTADGKVEVTSCEPVWNTSTADGKVEVTSCEPVWNTGQNFFGINRTFYLDNMKLFKVGAPIVANGITYYIDAMNLPENCNHAVALVYVANKVDCVDGTPWNHTEECGYGGKLISDLSVDVDWHLPACASNGSSSAPDELATKHDVWAEKTRAVTSDMPVLTAPDELSQGWAEMAVIWFIDSTTGGQSCDDVCANQGTDCVQSSLDALNGDTEAVLAAYRRAGRECENGRVRPDCEPGSNCVDWGSPYVHNNHWNQSFCWGGSVPSVAPCSQRPVDPNHRRLCPCDQGETVQVLGD